MMAPGLPATATGPGATASAPPAGTPVQGNATAQAAGNATRNDDPIPREDTGAAAGAFDLLLTGLPMAPATATDIPAAKPDVDIEPAVQDNTGAPDQLLLMLAQAAPALATPAPATAAMVLPGTTDAAPDALTNAALPLSPSAASATSTPSPAMQAIPQQAPADAWPATVALPGIAPDANAPRANASSDAPAALSTVADAVQATTQAGDAAPPPATTAMHASQAPATQSLPVATAAATPATAPLPQPADPAAGYDDSFATQVSWLAGQRIGEAKIQVSPEHLGAIDIRLQLDGDQVRAEFHSTQADVRQALEASLPRLRELLNQHGLQLAHAGVGHGRSQQDTNGTPFARTPGTTSRNEGDGLPPPAFRRARGLLDVYA